MGQTVTVGAWCEQYLAEKEPGWCDITKNSYHYLLRCHIVPGIGEIELEQLTSQRIQRFYDRLARSGLSGYSIQCVHLLLRRCLDEACRAGLMPQNPAKSCQVPQTEPAPGIPLRLGQIQRYLIAAESQGILPLAYLSLTGGLRQKELLSLRWSDFDRQGRIHKGKRLLTIDPKAMKLLRDEYFRHPDREAVFLNPKTGQPYLPHEFYYLHQKVLKAARLHPISFRELAKNCRGVRL